MRLAPSVLALQPEPLEPWRHYTQDLQGKYAITALVFLGVLVLTTAAGRRLEAMTGRLFTRVVFSYMILRGIRQLGGLWLSLVAAGWAVPRELTALVTVLTIATMASSIPLVDVLMAFFRGEEAPSVSFGRIRRAAVASFVISAIVVALRHGFPHLPLPSNAMMLLLANVMIGGHAVWVAVRTRDRMSVHFPATQYFLAAQLFAISGELVRLSLSSAGLPADTPRGGLLQIVQLNAILAVASALVLAFLLVVTRYPHARIQLEQERLRLAEAVRGARSHEARLGQFVVGLSHELRNLMLGVRMMETSLTSTGAPALEVSAVRLLNGQLEERILRLGAYAKPLPTQRDYVDLPLFVQRFRLVLDGLVTRHDLRMESSVRSLLVRVQLQVLEDAVVEVLSNARDFSEPDSVLEVRSDRMERLAGESPVLAEGAYGVLTISDQGVGLSASELAVVFEPTFTKRLAREAGFGLLSVRSQLRAAGGDLTIDSRVGEGTTVRLWLPTAETTV